MINVIVPTIMQEKDILSNLNLREKPYKIITSKQKTYKLILYIK
jgi:hypothetical protein